MLADRAELLRAAAEIVQRVQQTLCTLGTVCPTCSLTRRENWDEFQVAQELDGVVKRLIRCADRLAEEPVTQKMDRSEITR